MGKKNKGHKRGMLSRVGRKVGSLVGTGVQLLGLLSGAIKGVANSGSNFAAIPANVLYEYSGVQQGSAWNQQKAIDTAVTIGVTYLVGWGIKQVARRM